MSAICQMGLLTPVYGVSGVFCAAQTILSGPFSPPGCDHQFVGAPAGAAAAVTGIGGWAKADAAARTRASVIHALSGFMAASRYVNAKHRRPSPRRMRSRLSRTVACKGDMIDYAI